MFSGEDVSRSVPLFLSYDTVRYRTIPGIYVICQGSNHLCVAIGSSLFEVCVQFTGRNAIFMESFALQDPSGLFLSKSPQIPLVLLVYINICCILPMTL